MQQIKQLKANNAKQARIEAIKYAPCKLKSFSTTGDLVYISAIRAKEDKSPVATARKGNEIAVTFEVKFAEN